ncbi:MAG: sensor histidine kinase [Gemmatimonas sp.]
MVADDLSLTAHLAGFTCGLVLYGLLLSMTLLSARRREPAASEPIHRDTSPVALAVGISVLGLLWNAIALFYFASRDFRLASPSPWLGATAYAALGFLPAVVVHSAVVTTIRRPRVLIAIAYSVSLVGAALQYAGAAENIVPSPQGLQFLTVTYAVVLVALLAVYVRDRLPWRGSLTVVALAAFAVSALHLSRPESATTSLASELIGHHASLPLVLVLLFQDYRFAFGDIFLKRALSFLAIVGIALLLHSVIIDGASFGVRAAGMESPRESVRHIAAWVLTALAYPAVRRSVNYVVDRFVLNRTNFVQVQEEIERDLLQSATEDDAIGAVVRGMARAFDTTGAATVQRVVSQDDVAAGVTRSRRDFWTIDTTEEPRYALRVNELRGGRRILSEEARLINATTAMLARRVDAIRLSRERFDRDLREEAVMRLATEAELRALRAQLNPHFLFNALTTIGYLIKTSPDRALETLYRLTHLLRAVLRRSSGSFVTLQEEVELVESYLAIERARFEERLSFTIDVPAALRVSQIPPLTLQPLVENAIKHGIAPLARGGSVRIVARLEDAETSDRDVIVRDEMAREYGTTQTLILEVINSSGQMTRTLDSSGEGVGLRNLGERLQRHYASHAHVSLSSRDDATVARIVLPFSRVEHEPVTADPLATAPATHGHAE